jgi:hypothetical protein
MALAEPHVRRSKECLLAKSSDASLRVSAFTLDFGLSAMNLANLPHSHTASPRIALLFSITYKLQLCVTDAFSQPYAKHPGIPPSRAAKSQPLLEGATLTRLASTRSRTVLTNSKARAYNASPIMIPEFVKTP